MLTAAIALVVYVAAAFLPGQEPRYGVFPDKAACESAVAQAREQGVFATDCVAVEFPAPRVAPNKGA